MTRGGNKLNLVWERFCEVTGNNSALSFWERFSPQKKRVIILRIKLEWYQYLRAETFVDDLIEIAGEELTFSVEQLIGILYDDFLRQIRMDVDIKELYNRLKDKQAQRHKKRTEESFVRVSPNHWSLREQAVEVQKKMIAFDISISRKSALRGEVFLHDLARHEPSNSLFMSLEELITILLLDFIAEVQKGNQSSVMKRIMQDLRE